MDHSPEIALFVDFENIRYSVLNTYHRELCGSMLMAIGRRHGLVTLARAYADFEEHPPRVRRDLQVSGITAVTASSAPGGDRPKGGSDMEMLMDIFETLLDRPHVDTYMLMTGDRRFIRIVTMIRNRYGKNVVIAGVRGSVSNDLIEAAGSHFEPLEFEPVVMEERRDAFIRFVDRLERSKPFITFKYVAAAMTTSTEFPGLAEDEAREFVAQAIQDGILIKRQRPDGYRVLHLNRGCLQVNDLLGFANGEGEEASEPIDDASPEDYDPEFQDDLRGGALEEDEDFGDDDYGEDDADYEDPEGFEEEITYGDPKTEYADSEKGDSPA